MKTPEELRLRLRRQWESATTREARLLTSLGDAVCWPVLVPIGRPPPTLVASDLDAVKSHVEQWRRVDVGEVIWESTRYRAVSGPVNIPVGWKIRQPTEWINACADRSMRIEFESMAVLVERTDPIFHSLLVRRRALWRDKELNEVLLAARLAIALEPGCADGRPLRLLAVEGIDTKFFERNAKLVTALLDARFDGEVSQIGLEVFLGAFVEGDHWLLVIDLDGSLLPFEKQRVRSSELRKPQLPGNRLLIVENEGCQHQLPSLPETIAVLGSGFDLDWIESCCVQIEHVGYWGDIDTWGLQFLAAARMRCPQLTALMMVSQVYDQHSQSAVREPVIAGTDLPSGLTAHEQKLYQRLINEPCGRLEQEFLPAKFVQESILVWADA